LGTEVATALATANAAGTLVALLDCIKASRSGDPARLYLYWRNILISARFPRCGNIVVWQKTADLKFAAWNVVTLTVWELPAHG
jgi:hypothetical protein